MVTSFVAGEEPCTSPLPSSALVVLRLAVAGQSGAWDLGSLAVLYVVLTTAGVAAAGAALAHVRPSLLLLLLPVVVPLALPQFSRFFLSTYSEPAGLLGAVVLLCGVVVVAAAPHGPPWTRIVGLALALLGGVVAATAKPGYAVLALIALVVGALGGGRWVRAVVVVVVAALVVGPVAAALRWQQEEYGAVNTHNLVLTAVGPASGGDALSHLGLPPTYQAFLGRAYFPSGPSAFPEWDHVIAQRWPALRVEAIRYTVTHPRTALALFDTGLRAAGDPTLAYLPVDRADDPSATPIPVPRIPVGEQGADHTSLEQWLDGRSIVPAVVVLLAGLAQALVLIVRRRPCDRSARTAAALGVAAVTGGVLVTIAAIGGDGYFEIAKHVWLASYLGLVGLLAGAATTVAALRPLGQCPTSRPEADEPGVRPAQ